MNSFAGFTSTDFDAFDPKKWSSHAYNRERLEVKLKLSDLGKALMQQLAQQLAGQESGLTEERPSIFNQQKVRDLTLFFTRGSEARRELEAIVEKHCSMAEKILDPALHHKHIIVGLRIHADGIEFGLWLHHDAWVDWKNLIERCKEHYEREKLAEIIAGLDDSLCFFQGDRPTTTMTPVRSVVIEQLIGSQENAQPWTFCGEYLSCSDAMLAGPQLLERMAQVFSRLWPLHQFIAWRRDNDFHRLREVLKERREKGKMQFSALKTGDEVRILKGLAAGRTGVVEEIEKKGILKVRLGLMVVAVKVEDVAKP
jgi:transcription antitermination factor NusG